MHALLEVNFGTNRNNFARQQIRDKTIKKIIKCSHTKKASTWGRSDLELASKQAKEARAVNAKHKTRLREPKAMNVTRRRSRREARTHQEELVTVLSTSVNAC